MSRLGGLTDRKAQGTEASAFDDSESRQLREQAQAIRNKSNQTSVSPMSSVRQPLAVKNSMPLSSLDTNVQEQDEGATKRSIVSASSTSANGAMMNRFINQPIVKSAATSRLTTTASLYAAHAPSPLSIYHQGSRQLETSTNDLHHTGVHANVRRWQAQSASTLSSNVVKTPRKRAIPLEEVHCRNAPAQSPHKRSRGSSTATVATSTSSISAAINEVHIRSHGGGEREDAVLPPISTGKRTEDLSGEMLAKGDGDRVNTNKTVRIDKQSRISQSDRMSRDQRKLVSTLEWRKKFLRAFPSFRFYLDGYDATTKTEVELTIVSLGGQIEPFFSKAVTHLVTARKVAIPVTKDVRATTSTAEFATTGESIGSASAQEVSHKAAAVSSKASASTSARPHPSNIPSLVRASRFAGLRAKKSTATSLHSERNPFDEWLPPVPVNDILTKARNFGIKIWTHDKFLSVTAGLTLSNALPGSNLVVETSKGKQQQIAQHMLAPKPKEQAKSLSQMLEKEKVQGIHERDAKAARPDYYYFSRNSVYILVEDATGEHRPVMAQEWRKPSRDDEDVPWPVLYGELEGRCPFTKFTVEGDPRKRMRPNRHETLRRTVSLNHIRSHSRNVSLSPAPSNDSRGGYSIARAASPYPLASGNSMSVASTNITSTTSTAAPYGNSLGLLSPFHPLARKTAPTGIGLGRPSAGPRVTTQKSSRLVEGQARDAGSRPSAQIGHGSVVRKMLGLPDTRTAGAIGLKPGTSALPGHMLEQQGGMRRSVSTPTAVNELEAKPAREKRPGYCENCRVKYEDFDEHVQGRRHRKFATDDTNFAEIDELLRRISRPIATWALQEPSSQADDLTEPASDCASDEAAHLPDQHTFDGDSYDETTILNMAKIWQGEDAEDQMQGLVELGSSQEEDEQVDQLRQRIDAAAAAFRFRTGLEDERTVDSIHVAGTEKRGDEEQVSTSSPNAASYGVTHAQHFDDDASNTSASPLSSQEIGNHHDTSTKQHQQP